MPTFVRGTFAELGITLRSDEPLGLLDSSYLEDFFGIDGQITLRHAGTGWRFAVAMAEVLTETPDVAHDVFRGWADLAMLPDGEYAIQARVRDPAGNFVVIGAVAHPRGDERVVELSFGVATAPTELPPEAPTPAMVLEGGADMHGQNLEYLDRFRRALAAVIKGTLRHVDYLALYPAKVLADHGDNTLDLEPDNPALPKLVKVPMRTFLPGAQVEVAPGARVLLGFESGNPAKPVVHQWESGELVKLYLTATTQVVVECPDVRLAGPSDAKHVAFKEDVMAELDALKAKFNSHHHNFMMPPPLPVIETMTVPTPDLGSTKVKTE